MAHEDQEKGSLRPFDGKTIEDRIKTGLEEELSRLIGILGLGLELRVVWKPNHVRRSAEGVALSGEVQGSTIIIYEEDEAEALKALKHEFLDYVISHEVEAPYKDLVNRLIDSFQAETYRRKERLVERLSSVI
jgi:hypothetical protein